MKSWYICSGLHIKGLIKPPVTISQHHKPAKTVLFDRTAPSNFPHSVSSRRDRSGKCRFIYVTFSG